MGKSSETLTLAKHLISEIRRAASPSSTFHLSFAVSVEKFMNAHGRVSPKQLAVLREIYEEVTNP